MENEITFEMIDEFFEMLCKLDLNPDDYVVRESPSDMIKDMGFSPEFEKKWITYDKKTT